MIARLAALALALASAPAVAGEFEVGARLQATGIALKAQIEVEDDLYLDMAGYAHEDTTVSGHVTRTDTLTNQSVENVIRLRHHSAESEKTWLQGDPWTLKVGYAVSGWDITAPTTDPDPLTSGTLTLTWDPDEPFVDQAIAVLPPGLARHRVLVEITQVELSGGTRTLGELTDAFVFEAEIDVERYLHLDLDAVPTIDAEDGPDPDSVELVWDFVPGAEVYELETVHHYDTSASPDWSNATRIRLEDTHTRLNLAYDTGRLWYRVRGMGRGGEEFTEWIPGAWSSASDDHLDVSGYEPDWNWQYGAVHAEHGRRVETVSFFDGTQRKRQTAVRSAELDRSLVSQTAYDFEGRGVVQTLPAPTDDSRLGYEENFHTCTAVIGGVSETDALGPRCYDHADTMLDPAMLTGGLGADWWKKDAAHPGHDDTPYNGLVPDAEGYPFTRLVYGPDGRPRMQGGAGGAHRVRPPDDPDPEHMTRMATASVSQTHLDRWFGPEAGYAGHYTAELTRDPNHLWSMAYKNLRGQVVATALIGPAPDGMDAVYDTTASVPTITDDLMLYALPPDGDRARIVQVEHAVSSPGPATLTWTLDQPIYIPDAPCTYKEVPCLYDLSLRVIDADGQLLTLASLDPDTLKPTGAETTAVSLTGISGQQNLAWQVDFPEVGAYTIEKVLRLSSSGLDAELSAYEAWLRQEPETTDPAEPDIECMPDYEASFNANTSKCGCGVVSSDPDCVGLTTSGCDGLYQALVDDMTPGGDYYDVDWLEEWAWPSCEPNTCSPTNLDCEACKFWLNAGFYDPNGKLIASWADVQKHWGTSQGLWLDQVFGLGVQNQSTAPTWSPALSSTVGTDPDVPLDWGAAGPYSTPLQIHPEFCHYAWCVRLEDSEAWDKDLFAMDAAMASTQFGTSFDLMAQDPYFIGSAPDFIPIADTTRIQAMKAALADYNGLGPMLNFAQSQSADPETQWDTYWGLYYSTKLVLVEAQKEEDGCTHLYDETPTDGIADGMDPLNPTLAALQNTKAKDHPILAPDLISKITAALSDPQTAYNNANSATSGMADIQSWTPNCLCLDLEYTLDTAGVSAADLAAQIGVKEKDVQSWMNACKLSQDEAKNPQGQSPYLYNSATETWDETSYPVPAELQCWVYSNPCQGDCDSLLSWAIEQATEQKIAEHLDAFETAYASKCLGSVTETFKLSYPDLTYQVALYYYDQAGNRVATVPPEGVREADVALVAAWRAAYTTDPNAVPADGAWPQHRMVSDYTYNAQNQPLTQRYPDYDVVPAIDKTEADHSATTFLYDSAGRLRFSQNARQRGASKPNASVYSYLKYDGQGRVSESGQVKLTKSQAPADHVDELDFPSSGTEQVTHTTYDEALSTSKGAWFPDNEQENLRGRVAAVTWRVGSKPNTFDHSINYSYDVAGNVADLAVENTLVGLSDQRIKTLHYRFDALSGSVTGLDYQAGQEDAFSQRYVYDADNRLVSVWSSADGYAWDRDAAYFYFPTGELAREELGDQGVQGLDHLYTVQGWIRAVNGPYVAPDGQAVAGRDPGEDGLDGVGEDWAPDAFGFTLRYFEDDYAPVVGDLKPEGTFADASITGATDLYNGNLSAMTAAMALPDGTVMEPFGTVYGHDQLNRLKRSRPHSEYSRAGNTWAGAVSAGFGETMTYDGNGNIKSLERGGAGTDLFDALEYTYTNGTSNRLTAVTDSLGDVSDVDDIAAGSFSYDAVGSLSGDTFAKLEQLTWLINGKPSAVSHKKGQIPFLAFSYDGLGERVGKTGVVSMKAVKTWYVRDARGEVIAVYTERSAGGKTTMTLDEVSLMGGKRIGVWAPGLELGTGGGVVLNTTIPEAERWEHQARLRRYELTDHLGNVRVAISDVKRGVVSGEVVTGYAAEVVSAADYYPFGMLMPGRTGGEAYRYGFNGKEQDAEWAGEGNWYDYGFRMHNPRLGRFVSVDPLAGEYPWYSAYQYAGNKPTRYIDIDGLEERPSWAGKWAPSVKVSLRVVEYTCVGAAIFCAVAGAPLTGGMSALALPFLITNAGMMAGKDASTFATYLNRENYTDKELADQYARIDAIPESITGLVLQEAGQHAGLSESKAQVLGASGDLLEGLIMPGPDELDDVATMASFADLEGALVDVVGVLDKASGLAGDSSTASGGLVSPLSTQNAGRIGIAQSGGVGVTIDMPSLTIQVLRGDTLSQIAERWNVSVDTLAEVNGISNPDRINAGQTLTIPSQ